MTPESSVRWLDAAQQRSWRAYLVGTTLLTDRLDHELREEHNLSLAEYEILVRLSEAEDRRVRMAVLADSLSHSRSRITHTIARLEKGGLVRRVSCAEDGRGVQACLTDEGYTALERAATTHVQGVRRSLVDLVSKEDLQAVGRVFTTVTDALVGANPGVDIR